MRPSRRTLIAVELAPAVRGDDLGAGEAAPRPGRNRRAGPGVDEGHDLDAGRGEVGRRAPAVVAGGEDGRPPRGHRPAVEVGPDRAGEHHPGAVVVREGERALDRAGAEHRAAGGDAPEALQGRLAACGEVLGDALERPEGPAVVDAGHRRAQHHADVGERGELRRGRRGPVRPRPAGDLQPLGVEPPAGQEVLVREDDPRPGPPGGQRRHQAGGTRADHEEVAEGEGLLAGVPVGLARERPEAGGAADQRLVDPLPEGLRPHEGLVVEAGPDQRGGEPVDRQEVEAEARPAVLAEGLEAVARPPASSRGCWARPRPPALS